MYRKLKNCLDPFYTCSPLVYQRSHPLVPPRQRSKKRTNLIALPIPSGAWGAPGYAHTAWTTMTTSSIQDRTAEFRVVLAQAQKNRNSTRVGAQRQSLLTDAQRRAANGSPNGETKVPRRGARSEFARKAAEIGRGITGTMEKLERLAQCMSYRPFVSTWVWVNRKSICLYGLNIY